MIHGYPVVKNLCGGLQVSWERLGAPPAGGCSGGMVCYTSCGTARACLSRARHPLPLALRSACCVHPPPLNLLHCVQVFFKRMALRERESVMELKGASLPPPPPTCLPSFAPAHAELHEQARLQEHRGVQGRQPALLHNALRPRSQAAELDRSQEGQGVFCEWRCVCVNGMIGRVCVGGGGGHGFPCSFLCAYTSDSSADLSLKG